MVLKSGQLSEISERVLKIVAHSTGNASYVCIYVMGAVVDIRPKPTNTSALFLPRNLSEITKRNQTYISGYKSSRK